MSISQSARKGLMAAGALGALALGGAAIANAASSGSGGATQASSAAQQGYGAPGYGQPGPASGQRPDPTRPGGHRGANGRTEQALPSAVAAKVKAAAEKKLPGGTVLRVESDVDHGSPYEAHVRRSDGTEVEVLVDENFTVTAVNTMQHT